MEPWRTILKLIERDGAAALVTVAQVDGSTPREAGARMVVARSGAITGSIGGGPLEWAAVDLAKQMIVAGRSAQWKTVSLGPALDQCCGGRAELLHEIFRRGGQGLGRPAGRLRSIGVERTGGADRFRTISAAYHRNEGFGGAGYS